MHTFQPIDDGNPPLLTVAPNTGGCDTSAISNTNPDKQTLVTQYEQKMARQEQEIITLRTRVSSLEQELSSARAAVQLPIPVSAGKR